MAGDHRTFDQLHGMLVHRGGVVLRDDVLAAGFGVALLRAFIVAGHAELLRRRWVALRNAPEELRIAARAGVRLTCTSLARRRGWWMPEGVAPLLHVQVSPRASRPIVPADCVLHWARPLVPSPRSLLASMEDALQHIAVCLPRDLALVLWESAARAERIAPDAMRMIAWSSATARDLAAQMTGLSDSGLETLVVAPLRRWGLRVRQQIVLAGRPVDLLIGDRLVIQLDGWEFHSSAAQRSKDIAHDAELRLRGYTVLRFSYAQVVHDWPAVEAVIRRALAARLHLAA